jgi:hypothetical protein
MYVPRPPYPRERPGNRLQEAGWISGPFWTGVENRATTGIRSLDRPSRSELLYRLTSPRPFELPHVGGVKT